MKIKEENSHTMKSRLSSPIRSIPEKDEVQSHLRINSEFRASINHKGDYVPILAIPTAEFGIGMELENPKLHYKKENTVDTPGIDSQYKLLKNPTNASVVNI